MNTYPQPTGPQKLVVIAAFLVSGLMILGLFSLSKPVTASAAPPASNLRNGAAPTSAPAAGRGQPPPALGSAHLDLNALAQANSIDEADNARWSLVRGTSLESQVYRSESGVNWKALRKVTLSGVYPLPAGSTWSFNATFGGGRGYKNASGVLAGGQCALATVFRAAAIQAGLPNKAHPHTYPIPGFPLNQTVTIWWGRDDLTIHNSTARDLYLAWDLTPAGVTVRVNPGQ